jgi:hypothetical protein
MTWWLNLLGKNSWKKAGIKAISGQTPERLCRKDSAANDNGGWLTTDS